MEVRVPHRAREILPTAIFVSKQAQRADGNALGPPQRDDGSTDFDVPPMPRVLTQRAVREQQVEMNPRKQHAHLALNVRRRQGLLLGAVLHIGHGATRAQALQHPRKLRRAVRIARAAKRTDEPIPFGMFKYKASGPQRFVIRMGDYDGRCGRRRRYRWLSVRRRS